jgi:hypothetical protein
MAPPGRDVAAEGPSLGDHAVEVSRIEPVAPLGLSPSAGGFAGTVRLERTTRGFGDRCSTKLSYAPMELSGQAESRRFGFPLGWRLLDCGPGPVLSRCRPRGLPVAAGGIQPARQRTAALDVCLRGHGVLLGWYLPTIPCQHTSVSIHFGGGFCCHPAVDPGAPWSVSQTALPVSTQVWRLGRLRGSWRGLEG